LNSHRGREFLNMRSAVQLILPFQAGCSLRGAIAKSAMQEIGKLLVVFGLLAMLLGAALWSGLGAGWLGRLPGDIRIERGNSSFYFPIVTCIVISVVLSIIVSFFRR